MILNILLLLGVSSCVCFAQEDFIRFQQKFHKNYQTSEVALREKIFNENLAKIAEHNKQYEQGLVSYKMGVNQFTDLTEEEFSSRFNTLQLDNALLMQNAKEQDTSEIDAYNLAPIIDWRANGVVTPVKDQGDCGASWTFSATGTLEGQYALTYGELVSFSEQELLDCTTDSNHGCNGGVVQSAIGFVSQYGITTEDQYPYKAAQGKCNATNKPVAASGVGYVNIVQYNEMYLKAAVAIIGPISVAVNADQLQLYTSGVFNATCNDTVNHGVLVVGYNAVNKSAPYWIVKNSLGPSWGENGYFRMAMGVGKGLCGITAQPGYPYLVKNTTTTTTTTTTTDTTTPANSIQTNLYSNKFITILGLLLILSFTLT